MSAKKNFFAFISHSSHEYDVYMNAGVKDVWKAKMCKSDKTDDSEMLSAYLVDIVNINKLILQ